LVTLERGHLSWFWYPTHDIVTYLGRGVWGIPEKNYQKLAQQRKLDHSNVLPAHEMTRSPFAGFSPIVIPIENFKWDAQYRLWVYKFENLRAALY